jgi:hypothetical protein
MISLGILPAMGISPGPDGAVVSVLGVENACLLKGLSGRPGSFSSGDLVFPMIASMLSNICLMLECSNPHGRGISIELPSERWSLVRTEGLLKLEELALGQK